MLVNTKIGMYTLIHLLIRTNWLSGWKPNTETRDSNNDNCSSLKPRILFTSNISGDDFSNNANPMRNGRLSSNNMLYMNSKCQQHVNLYACYFLPAFHSYNKQINICMWRVWGGGAFKIFHLYMLKGVHFENITRKKTARSLN